MRLFTSIITVLIVAPFVIIAAVYVLGWMLTILIYIMGLHPFSSARGVGIAISIVISIMYINYLAHEK